MTLAQQSHLQKVLTDAYQCHEKELINRACFKLSNYELGKDLVQQTFMKAWLYLMKGGTIEKMGAFLYHILNNLIIDEYRKSKATSLDALMDKGFEPGVSDPKNFFNILDGKAALNLIERLPEMYRNVMRMKYLQDLSLQEISKLTGLSKNTIAVQLHRGLEKIKSIYWHQENMELSPA